MKSEKSQARRNNCSLLRCYIVWKGIGKISDINEKTWEFFEKTWEIFGKTWEIILEISDVLFLAREKWRGGDESGKRKIATSVSRYDNLTRTLFVEKKDKTAITFSEKHAMRYHSHTSREDYIFLLSHVPRRI